MHTSVQLQPELFSITIRGEDADLSALFPAWNKYDRVGVLVDSPFGLLGASLLVQSAICAYFEHRRQHVDEYAQALEQSGERESLQGLVPGFGVGPVERAERAKVAFAGYGDVYALHLGQPHGDHSGMDVWPPNRERVVARDFDTISIVLADLGITRLLIPDAAPVRGEVDWEVRAVLRERVKSVFVYSAQGRVPTSDIEIRGTSPNVDANANMVLSMRESVAQVESAPPSANPDGTRRTIALMKSRLDEVPDDVRTSIVKDREARLDDGVRIETYRSVSLQGGLDLINGLTAHP